MMTRERAEYFAEYCANKNCNEHNQYGCECDNCMYELGRADAIDECIALARAEIDFESQAEQKRFVDFMEQLKEKKNEYGRMV